MSLILAIEPDPRQAAQITAIARTRVGAELRLAATTEQALDVIGNRVPDLVLVPALLSPQDDAALAAALRVIAAAAHVRTLTIPALASGVPHTSTGGMLAKWRKSKPEAPAPDGCDPAVFAEQISSYLREAAAERESRESSSFEDESSPAYEPVDAAAITSTAIEAAAVQPMTPIAAEEESRFVQAPAYTAPQFFEERPVFDEERPILFGKQFDDEHLDEEPAIPPGIQPEIPPAAATDVDESIAPEFALSTEPEAIEMPTMASNPVVERDEASVESTVLTTDAADFVTEPMLAAPSEPVVETATLEELAEEEADDSLTVSVEPSFTDQEPVIAAAAPWIEFDLSDELGDGDEPVFELEAGDAAAMLFEDPAFAAFAAAPSKPTALIAPTALPVETDFERRLAAYAEPVEEEGDTIAEIFAALSHVDQFIVRNERPAAQPEIASIAPARDIEFFAPVGLTGYRWPRLEGMAAELVDRRELKSDSTATAPAAVAAAAPGPARPAHKTETHKADRPEWSELIASLRQDIERLRGGNHTPVAVPVAARPGQAAPAPRPANPGAEPGSTKPKTRGPKPIQDEWGFFDPEQCGFAALVAKLSEITDSAEETELHAH